MATYAKMILISEAEYLNLKNYKYLPNEIREYGDDDDDDDDDDDGGGDDDDDDDEGGDDDEGDDEALERAAAEEQARAEGARMAAEAEEENQRYAEELDRAAREVDERIQAGMQNDELIAREMARQDKVKMDAEKGLRATVDEQRRQDDQEIEEEYRQHYEEREAAEALASDIGGNLQAIIAKARVPKVVQDLEGVRKNEVEAVKVIERAIYDRRRPLSLETMRRIIERSYLALPDAERGRMQRENQKKRLSKFARIIKQRKEFEQKYRRELLKLRDETQNSELDNLLPNDIQKQMSQRQKDDLERDLTNLPKDLKVILRRITDEEILNKYLGNAHTLENLVNELELETFDADAEDLRLERERQDYARQMDEDRRAEALRVELAEEAAEDARNNAMRWRFEERRRHLMDELMDEDPNDTTIYNRTSEMDYDIAGDETLPAAEDPADESLDMTADLNSIPCSLQHQARQLLYQLNLREVLHNNTFYPHEEDHQLEQANVDLPKLLHLAVRNTHQPRHNLGATEETVRALQLLKNYATLDVNLTAYLGETMRRELRRENNQIPMAPSRLVKSVVKRPYLQKGLKKAAGAKRTILDFESDEDFKPSKLKKLSHSTPVPSRRETRKKSALEVKTKRKLLSFAQHDKLLEEEGRRAAQRSTQRLSGLRGEPPPRTFAQAHAAAAAPPRQESWGEMQRRMEQQHAQQEFEERRRRVEQAELAARRAMIGQPPPPSPRMPLGRSFRRYK